MEEATREAPMSFAQRLEAWDREFMRIDEAGLWSPPEWERSDAGRILRRRRIFEGLSQRELAACSGVGQSDVCRVERGLDCRWSTLRRLAVALGCEPVLRLRPRDPSKLPSRHRPARGRRRRRDR